MCSRAIYKHTLVSRLTYKHIAGYYSQKRMVVLARTTKIYGTGRFQPSYQAPYLSSRDTWM